MAKSIKSKRNFRDALAAAARTFSGDSGVMLELSDKDATDCGKAIVIRDPDLLIGAGLDEELATTTAKVSTTHESGHIKFGTDIVKFNEAIIKLTMKGADRELAFRALNFAEDCRVDAAMGRERPGYQDQRKSSARAFIPKLYKQTSDVRTNMHLATLAEYYDVDLGWSFTAEQREAINRAKALYRECEETTSTDKAMVVGAKVYVALYGDPRLEDRKPEPLEEKLESFFDGEDGEDRTPPPPSVDEDFDEDEDYDMDDLDKPVDESDDDDGDDDDEDDSTEDRAEEKRRAMADDEDESLLDDPVDKASVPDGLKDWLKEREGEVMGGDSLADGVGDDRVKVKKWEDEILARGSKDLARAQSRENNRKSSTEILPICAEIEGLYSKDVDAGVKIAYFKQRDIDEITRLVEWRARQPHLIAPVADLTQTFKDLLRKARERDTFLHRSGSVRADKVWRGTIMGDGRVFTRHEEKGAGGYAIKILMDASGSMGGSEQKAADVAYIITKALMQAGMNVCVEDFDAGSSSCWVYHSFLVPWNSSKAERVFAYSARHQNRDNFSLKAAAYELAQRQEQHKIMIVVSDGSPYHGGSSKAIEKAGGVPGGGGKQLIDDAAKAVREARTKGIKVLGIYFGIAGGSTAKTEAYIYGKDFVIADDLNRIVPSVRTYLGRILAGT